MTPLQIQQREIEEMLPKLPRLKFGDEEHINIFNLVRELKKLTASLLKKERTLATIKKHEERIDKLTRRLHYELKRLTKEDDNPPIN